MEKLNTGATKRTGQEVNNTLTEIFGSRFQEYREAWNNAKPGAVPDFPVHVDFELFDGCNQRCTFCARNSETHPDIPYQINTGMKLDNERINKIIEHTSSQGLYSVNFAWGEPLLYKNIFDVIKQFHNSGIIDSRIVTNGLLLSKFTDQIFESSLVNLYVSIDAFTEKTYSKQRGRGYQKIVDNLLNFLEQKRKRKSILPITRVSLVETEENKDEIEPFKEFWSDKIDIIETQILSEFNKSEYDEAINKKWNCIEPFRRLSVMANGDILPCCSFFGKTLVIGNINTMTIKEAWDSEEMKKVRENLLNDKESVCLVCQGC